MRTKNLVVFALFVANGELDAFRRLLFRNFQFLAFEDAADQHNFVDGLKTSEVCDSKGYVATVQKAS